MHQNLTKWTLNQTNSSRSPQPKPKPSNSSTSKSNTNTTKWYEPKNTLDHHPPVLPPDPPLPPKTKKRSMYLRLPSSAEEANNSNSWQAEAGSSWVWLVGAFVGGSSWWRKLLLMLCALALLFGLCCWWDGIWCVVRIMSVFNESWFDDGSDDVVNLEIDLHALHDSPHVTLCSWQISMEFDLCASCVLQISCFFFRAPPQKSAWAYQIWLCYHRLSPTQLDLFARCPRVGMAVLFSYLPHTLMH